MKASELIEELVKIVEATGDKDVLYERSDHLYAIDTANVEVWGEKAYISLQQDRGER